MDQRWRQPTPQMELGCIRMAIEGHFANWRDGIISNCRFEAMMNDLLKQLSDLQPHLERGSWPTHADVAQQ